MYQFCHILYVKQQITLQLSLSGILSIQAPHDQAYCFWQGKNYQGVHKNLLTN